MTVDPAPLRHAMATVLIVALLGGCVHRHTRAWPVMGTMLEISLWTRDDPLARRALDRARAVVFRVDSLMSTYRSASELSTINRRAGSDTATIVSLATAAVLTLALKVAERTGGGFDVTVGPLVDAWGFHGGTGSLPSPATVESARAHVGFRRIEWNPNARTVRLPDPGMRLDFGAIAKGYAIDRAVEALEAEGIRRAMVDLGGNIRVLGAAPGQGGWRIGLRDPRESHGVFAIVTLPPGGAIATSGIYERFFTADGERYAHVIDPRTGRPVRDVAAVSVVAGTGMLSDALSTALLVLGPERGCRVLRRFPGAGAVWARDPGARPAGKAQPLRLEHVVVSSGIAGRIHFLLDRSTPGLARVRPSDVPSRCTEEDA